MEAETTNTMLGKYLPFSPVQMMKNSENNGKKKYKNRCGNEKKKTEADLLQKYKLTNADQLQGN